MRVAIVSPYQTVNPHFEAELELYQRHLDQGDEVDYWACLGEQTLCDFNFEGDRQACRECAARRRMGLQLLTRPSRPLPLLREPVDSGLERARWPRELPWEFRDLDELRKFRIDQFDIGYACLSSLVSIVRDPHLDVRLHAGSLRHLMLNSWHVYRRTVERLKSDSVDRVYVFNGRFAAMRAVLRAAQHVGVPCWIHERGGTFNRFQLFFDHLPHDLVAMEERMRRFWAESPAEWREQAGAQWYIDRRNRVERGWKSFVKGQVPARLPEDWESNAHHLVLFCSSEDEFAAIGDSWDQRPYPTQAVGVQHLLSLCSRPDLRLTVRLHPNLSSAPGHLTDAFLKIQDPRLRIILPDSSVDSYALVDHASTILSFGSSVGIEAVYHGKPSILLGPCFYRALGGTYQPIAASMTNIQDLPASDPSLLELRRCLNEPLAAQDKTGALQFGFWLQENGIEYQHYRASGFNEGLFRNEVVYARPEPSRWTRWRKKLKAWRHWGRTPVL